MRLSRLEIRLRWALRTSSHCRPGRQGCRRRRLAWECRPCSSSSGFGASPFGVLSGFVPLPGGDMLAGPSRGEWTYLSPAFFTGFFYFYRRYLLTGIPSRLMLSCCSWLLLIGGKVAYTMNPPCSAGGTVVPAVTTGQALLPAAQPVPAPAQATQLMPGQLRAASIEPAALTFSLDRSLSEFLNQVACF